MSMRLNTIKIVCSLFLSLLLYQSQPALAAQHSVLTKTIAAVTKTNTRLALFSTTCLATTAGAAWLAHHYLKPKTPPSTPPGTASISPAPTPTNVVTSPATVAVTSAQQIASIEASLKIMNSTSPFTVTQCMLLEKLYQSYGDRAIDVMWYAVTKKVDSASQETLDGVFNQTTIQAMLDQHYNDIESTTYKEQAKEARLVDLPYSYFEKYKNLPDKILRYDGFLRLINRIFVRDILQETAEQLKLLLRFPKKAVYFQPQLAFFGEALLLIDKINKEDASSWEQGSAFLRDQLDILRKNTGITLDLDLCSDNFTLHDDHLIGIDTENSGYFLSHCPPAPPDVMEWYKAWKKQRGSHFKLKDDKDLKSAEHAFKKSHPDF